MEYIGTLLVAVICLWLGYVLGRIKWKQEYKKGYSDGSWDGMAKYLERYWGWSNKQKEEQKGE